MSKIESNQLGYVNGYLQCCSCGGHSFNVGKSESSGFCSVFAQCQNCSASMFISTDKDYHPAITSDVKCDWVESIASDYNS